MKDDIRRWIESGADVPSGLRLLALLSPNPPLARLLTLNPGKYRPLLVRKLSALAGIDTATHQVPDSPATPMRREWPFLSSPDCPAELKILAADKITAYHNYVEAHAALFSCTSPEECFSTAKKVMENFIENRKILSEFSYYREHHRPLGQHPVFKERREVSKLHKLSIPQLCRRRDNLREAIWRARPEIERGDRPHLREIREKRIAAKERELATVLQILSAYD